MAKLRACSPLLCDDAERPQARWLAGADVDIKCSGVADDLLGVEGDERLVLLLLAAD